MRHKSILLLLLGFALLWAATDPFAGTWVMNRAKTTYRTGQAPRELTIVIDPQGRYLDVTVKGTAGDGSPMLSRYSIPIAGGKGTVAVSNAFDAVSSKRIDANTRENTYYMGTTVVQTTRPMVSRDGKTLTVEVKGTDAHGQPFDGTATFDRR